jgi:hypothetical protein
MASGPLRDSRLAPFIQDCCARAGVTPADDYEFEKLEQAIYSADELITEAGELVALGKDAVQEVVFALGYVVVSLVQICKPSNQLKRLMVDVCEAIVGLDELGGSIRWQKNSQQALYRNALVAMTATDAAVNSILEGIVQF